MHALLHHVRELKDNALVHRTIGMELLLQRAQASKETIDQNAEEAATTGEAMIEDADQ